MRAISWNCQGIGSALTDQALFEMKKKFEPKVFFLMETNNSEKNPEKEEQRVGASPTRH